jgi:hypothetical protein
MVFDEFAAVIDACSKLLSNNKANTPIKDEEWTKLVDAIAASTTLTNEAFAGATNCVVASNIANKEMFDFVASMSRFLDVYDEDRTWYYKDAEAYYTPHINLLAQQKVVLKSLYDKGDKIINGS